MGEYVCPNCSNNTFKMIKDEKNSNFYGYEVWKLKCMGCGEEFENDKYLNLLNTFSKTRMEVDNIVKEFSEDTNMLRNSMQKLVGVKNTTGELESILRKLNFIYFEENTDLINSPKTIAILIKSNLPNGVEGDIQDNKKSESEKIIKLKDDKQSNIGTIKISRSAKNIMEINTRIAGKKVETINIEEPFRIVQVLLRLNEIVNFTN